MDIKGLRTVLFSLLALFASQTQAITLTPADCVIGDNCWTSPENRNPSSDALATLTGISGLSVLYKANVGGADEGPYADAYRTGFFNSATDPEDALISFLTGFEAIDCTTGCFLTVKGGNTDPSLYVFDISDWNGTDSISILDFWLGKGAISNIAIWSKAVPEPVTLSLMGIGLIILAASRRRKS